MISRANQLIRARVPGLKLIVRIATVRMVLQKNSGLHLLASETDMAKLGVGKAPVAAGKGSGGLLYDIVPGKPDESILQFRIESVHPGIMMPELGRSITHEEGVELVRKWIGEMK